MEDTQSSVTDDLLEHAADYPAVYVEGEHTPRPRRHISVVACMDARLDLFALLGLHPGDCHVLRNAGGIITEDMVRSLVVSQRALGTREVVLIHHTDCGMERVVESEFFDALETETGQRPSWSLGDFDDVEANVRESIARLRTDPFLPHRDAIRGFVFDVDTGKLREVV